MIIPEREIEIATGNYRDYLILSRRKAIMDKDVVHVDPIPNLAQIEAMVDGFAVGAEWMFKILKKKQSK